MLMTAASSTDRLSKEGRRELDNRMHELRLKYKDVAERSGMSTAHLRRILNGDQSVSDDKAIGLEDALQLKRGSIASLLAGGPLTPAEAAGGRGKSLAQLLVERGLAAPADVTLADEVVDPGIWEILDLPEMSEQAKDDFLMAYQAMRRSILSMRGDTKRPRE